MGAGIEGVSVLVPTFNEELNLPDCLESAKGAGEVFIVHSFSADHTRRIAQLLSAQESCRSPANGTAQATMVRRLLPGPGQAQHAAGRRTVWKLMGV